VEEKLADDAKREAYKKACDDNEMKAKQRQEKYKEFFV